ncbi:hypothetical protein NDU88_002277 [Pleurodeles waltl]|uniref:Uncharacterized protein n=1 Tax=Pleurodeles waltl TaxID=8319 RepID=A0AAV7P6G5_PLEWA|nr:hypothetical protein NDU88_002277 [Pleurodeles waltl]
MALNDTHVSTFWQVVLSQGAIPDIEGNVGGALYEARHPGGTLELLLPEKHENIWVVMRLDSRSRSRAAATGKEEQSSRGEREKKAPTKRETPAATVTEAEGPAKRSRREQSGTRAPGNRKV